MKEPQLDLDVDDGFIRVRLRPHPKREGYLRLEVEYTRTARHRDRVHRALADLLRPAVDPKEP